MSEKQQTDSSTDQAKEKVRQVLDKVADAIFQFKGNADQVVQVSKLKFDSTRLQNEKKNLMHQLGEKTYAMCSDDQWQQDQIQPLIDHIQNLDDQIKEQNQNIDAIKSKTTTPD